ncbi:phosphatase PAP2 family protein [Solwaraspora sp. WMMD1047]|uniref:phosphatase PAP2 family protein n=1 Tax=Solwaraspora sp. WMMD1047 TaxID=3016102 RepID=UPI002417BF25|nr:phosphatase PAP2 family protein [Solwaraspora sp. WMMD1047]MDG4829082.1 phosphatase PAP2 family protein [Solwaraspora sp. WMMD1047]
MTRTVGQAGWRLVAGLALVAIGNAAGFALVYWLTVRTTPGRRFGDRTMRGAGLSQPQLSEGVDRVLDVVSVASLFGAVAAVAVIALLRLLRLRGLAAVGLLVAANLATQVLKHVLPRPDLGLREITPATWNSLPSGHSTAAFSVVVAVLFVVPARVRMVTAVIGVGYVSATAVATISAGWHRAGDSLAAFLLVAALTAVAGIVVATIGDSSKPAQSAPVVAGRNARWTATMASATVGVGATGALALVADYSFLDSRAGYAAALFTSSVLVTGMAIVTTAVVLLVLDWVTTSRSRGAGSRPAGVAAQSIEGETSASG